MADARVVITVEVNGVSSMVERLYGGLDLGGREGFVSRYLAEWLDDEVYLHFVEDWLYGGLK